MSYHRCSKCASDQVMDGAFVADAQGPRVVVGVSRHPDHGALETTVSTQVHASVCGSCGYVELYANRRALGRTPPSSGHGTGARARQG